MWKLSAIGVYLKHSYNRILLTVYCNIHIYYLQSWSNKNISFGYYLCYRYISIKCYTLASCNLHINCELASRLLIYILTIYPVEKRKRSSTVTSSWFLFFLQVYFLVLVCEETYRTIFTNHLELFILSVSIFSEIVVWRHKQVYK